MKKSVFIAICLLLASVVSAQSEIQNVATGFQNGNPSAVSDYFDNNVELIILSVNGTFSKQKAADMLSDFFRKNPVQRFNLAHRGISGNSSFGTGNLSTPNGDFRVYFLFRKKGNLQVIKTLRIEAI